MWKPFMCFAIYLRFINGSDINTAFSIPDNNYTNEFSSISNCIIDICEKELYFRPTIGVLMTKNADETFINTLIAIIIDNSIPYVAIDKAIINDEINAKTRNWLIVVYVNNCDDFINFNPNLINKRNKYIVTIPRTIDKDCMDTFKNIGDAVGKHDVTFIVRDPFGDKHNVLTFIPQIDAESCEEVISEPLHINTCSNGFMHSNDIFPLKNPTNLNKCPFKVGMATLYPFSRIRNMELLQTFDIVDEIEGSDLEILKIVNEYFNATLEVHYIYRKEESPYGDYDFLEFITNGSLDVCAGGLYRIYGDKVFYSGVYTRQAVIWMYNAKRAEKSWQNLIKKVHVLYIFFIFYITHSVTWFLICTFDKDRVSLRKTLLYSWGGLVGATSIQDPRSIKQKTLYISYSILCICLSVYMSTQLYSFLTIVGPSQVFLKNDDLMESGRLPYLKAQTKYFMNDEKYIKFANTSEDCTSFLDCASKSVQYNGVTVVLQSIFYYFQALTAVNDEASVLSVPENLLTVYYEMLIRKSSSLVGHFQKIIQRLFEMGITGRLYVEAVGISVVAKSETVNSNMMISVYNCQFGCSIAFQQIAGIFYAWLIGCGVSILVFVIEVFSKRNTVV